LGWALAAGLGTAGLEAAGPLGSIQFGMGTAKASPCCCWPPPAAAPADGDERGGGSTRRRTVMLLVSEPSLLSSFTVSCTLYCPGRSLTTTLGPILLIVSLDLTSVTSQL